VATAGYSGTPQLKKLGIVPGRTWDVDGRPEAWSFEEEPDAAAAAPTGAVDVVVAFVRSAAEIDPAYERLEQRIRPAGAIWIAWPRKAAGHVSDVTDNAVRDAALERGLVDIKVAAIDTDWSGLKLVWRRELR
jgi:hypothetical protein